jgi:protein-L-isoaspartate(D-aspartate) O-methyltransferase
MVDWIRRVYGLDEPQILEAMQNVPRHWFVPGEQQANAYIDSPLPIGEGQTISQPFIVAYMTHLLGIGQDDRVLEIGTGSGYQAAVLNEFTPHVFTIEIIPSLGARAFVFSRSTAIPRSASKSATGTRAGLNSLPSMRLSSPAPRIIFRPRCLSSLSRAAE